MSSQQQRCLRHILAHALGSNPGRDRPSFVPWDPPTPRHGLPMQESPQEIRKHRRHPPGWSWEQKPRYCSSALAVPGPRCPHGGDRRVAGVCYAG